MKNLLLAGRLLAVSLLAALAASCGGRGDQDYDPPMPTLPPAPTAAPQLGDAALAVPFWTGVLVAGSPLLNVDDDAMLELDARFQAAGIPVDRLRTLSAQSEGYGGDRPARAGGGSQPRHSEESADAEHAQPSRNTTLPARPAVLLREIIRLDAHQNAACFLYLSGTGDKDGLALEDGSVTPDQLDRALEFKCADAPTVVVVSGCGTGAFAASPMARPNRLILTAAAAGRSGFGCGPNQGFTTFDECFIGSLDWAATWVQSFDRTRACMARREAIVQQPPVAPQAYVGALVARLPAPWASRTGPDGVVRHVQFSPGIGRFTLDGVPYFSTLKARTRATLEAYAHATAPKALALTFAGTVAFGEAGRGETPDDVARLALERCEWQSGGSCVLYALNADLAASDASGVPPIHPPMLARSGAVTAATVPFIRDDQRPAVEAYLRAPEPKALALGPADEALGAGSGATLEEARRAALERCGTGCVIYAEGGRVTLQGPP